MLLIYLMVLMTASQWISTFLKYMHCMPRLCQQCQMPYDLFIPNPNTAVMERMVMFILWITKRSGTEEKYSELSQLLQDITTYRRDMEEYEAKTAKEKEQKKRKRGKIKRWVKKWEKKPWKGWYPVSVLHSFAWFLLTCLLVFNYILLAALKVA